MHATTRQSTIDPVGCCDPVVEPIPAYPDRVLLPLSFDAALLQRDLAWITGTEWTRHFVTQNFDGEWSVLPLRICEGATHPVMMIYSDPAATAFVDGPLLAQTPYLGAVLARFECPVQTARLMKLTPGSVIKPHRDHELAAEQGSARIHIPIVTNDAVDFRLNGERIVMVPGSAWYLRLSDPHSVANEGTTDRVHLVIDCLVNDWLRAMLAG